MAKKDGPRIQQVRVRNEDGSAIMLYVHEDGYQELTIKLTDEMLKFLVEENHGTADYDTHEILLAEYDPKAELLTTYPTTVQPGSNYFGFGKYISVQRISTENARPIWDGEDDDDDGRLHFRQFPPGFVYDPFDGFGLIYMLRFIVEAIEEFPEVVDIRLCRDSETSIKDGIFRLPTAIYEPVRKTLGRTHRSAVNFANEEKRDFLRSELVVPHKPEEEGRPAFRRTAADLKAVLGDAINIRGRRSQARSTNETAAVRVVRSSAKELITEHREEILELNREIELVTLEDVIAKFETKLANPNLAEGSWQKFLSNNPFILRLAFGLPAIVFKEQMPVGGVDLDNKGGKLADFVVKSGAIGNLAIVEIKTPKATLLGKKLYRGGIHAPSVGISGAVTQVMDQRYQLQKNITMLLGNSPNTDASTYAIGCIVIAGTTPTVEPQKKSFELYRNNLAGVVVITFDELLEKLKALHEFLVEQPRPDSDDGADQADEDEEYDEDEDLEEDLEEDLG
ncbi:MAG: DUF4263 domain-containing protein [Mesorhizobium sp.]|nr:MAG: DUF4263 domain-containing protein [Mesorhizobium sp.]